MKREFSGKFVLRLDEALHETLSKQAEKAQTSLNSFCVQKLKQHNSEGDYGLGVNRILKQALEDWLAVVAFGSQVKGQARQESDVDLLVIVKNSVVLSPQLYKDWDAQFAKTHPKVSPHFVHLLSQDAVPSSLWLEVAISGLILKDENFAAHRSLTYIREKIASGQVHRKLLHGQPYWVWSTNKVG